MKKLDSATPGGEPNTIGVLDKGYVRLIRVAGDDLDIVNSARASYSKESSLDENGELSERDIRLLNYLIREGHESPFRHSSLTFEVYAPLMIARQWWRYGVASAHLEDQNAWSESSRRYITEVEEFYVPSEDKWREAPANSKQGSGEIMPPFVGMKWSVALQLYINKGVELYNKALEDGVAPEQARLFLPANGLYVRWRWTASLAAVLHYLDQRLDSHAQAEIREYARAVDQLTEQSFPKTLAAWRNRAN